MGDVKVVKTGLISVQVSVSTRVYTFTDSVLSVTDFSNEKQIFINYSCVQLCYFFHRSVMFGCFIGDNSYSPNYSHFHQDKSFRGGERRDRRLHITVHTELVVLTVRGNTTTWEVMNHTFQQRLGLHYVDCVSTMCRPMLHGTPMESSLWRGQKECPV